MQPVNASLRSKIACFFYGNYFYGCCVLTLSAETLVRHKLPMPPAAYWILIFACTVFYYSLAYIKTPLAYYPDNLRLQWYTKYRSLIKGTQAMWLLVILTHSIYLLSLHPNILQCLAWPELLGLVLFPILAFCYDPPFMQNWALRSLAYLKPFIVAGTWAGVANYYPVLYAHLSTPNSVLYKGIFWLHFTDTWLFITALCILFDLKDETDDNNRRLQTFATRLGFYRTLYWLVIPLTLAAMVMGILAHLPRAANGWLILCLLPCLLLITAAFSLYRTRSVLYYLLVIDGLMLVKGALGILLELA